MGPEFFQTGMGRQFFESTLPKLVKALERIGEVLEPPKNTQTAQFARLLSHIFAEGMLSPTNKDELADMMGIPVDDVERIFFHADELWQQEKETQQVRKYYGIRPSG